MAVTISSPEPSLTITNATNQITFSLGRAGADGQGVAAGGTTGQVLAKALNTDYDTEWTSVGAGDMLAANNLSDVASAATAFGNIKQAASTTTTGVVELATDGEALAGKVVQGNDSRLSDTRDPNAHASEHTDGTDDIQSATNLQKGLATAAHITAIEANTAKVTCNTSTVTAAGALMDSEVTNLAQVKAFDSSDYATAAQGSLADSSLQSGDNISTLTNDSGFTTNTGTVDTSRTPVANDFARFTDADTIEGRSYSEVRTDLNVAKGQIGILIDGAGSAITTGIKADLEVAYDCTVNEVRLLADQSGSAVVDIWKDTYVNYPPTDADSITASAVPTLSAATKSEDSTLTGWTTSLTKGDILRFNVDSASTVTRLTVVLEVTRA